jgi:hypothetical protein
MKIHSLKIVLLSIVVAISIDSMVLAGDNGMFISQINKAVDNIIIAWMQGDDNNLESSFGQLVKNETYLLAMGDSDKKHSYLMFLPKGLSDRPYTAAAYIFLIRKKREGSNLFPKHLFEGKKFIYTDKGDR